MTTQSPEKTATKAPVASPPPVNEPEEMIIDTSKMNEGKRDALELAEASRDSFSQRSSFCASLFMGDFDADAMFPYPAQSDEDRAAGDVFLKKLNAYLRDKTDPDQIDIDGEVPQEVIDGLVELGALGIKVPKEYSGLGLSQTNYARAAVQLGSWCGNLTALLSAHQSIGVGQPLMQFGTDEQKRKYLPKVATDTISAFALTERGVGSDPARMQTTATLTEDGKHWVINGEKLWCTNGTKAGVIIVMAKTPPKIIKGRERNQISAFIVEMDTPGIEIVQRCRFMGLKALYNGVIAFKDVKIPADNLIGGEGRGLKVALTTLNTGRLTLPAACLGTTKRCLEINREWAAEREQWGAPIGHHAAIAEKIARMASNMFATEAMTFYTTALVDRKQGDIRIEAALCKMWGTERGWEDVDETMQIRGGRGFETAASLAERGAAAIPVERLMRDSRINKIFEGSSEIMRLFIAREALDPHLKAAGAVLNPKLPVKRRLKTAVSALGFYALWYPKQWLPAGFSVAGKAHPKLRRHVRYGARGSRRLSRALIHSMGKFGPALEREQVILGHIVDIGAELFAISASCARATHMIENGTPPEEVLPIVDFFCREAKLRIRDHHKGIRKNNNKRGYKLARNVLDGKHPNLEAGIVG